MQSSLSSNSTTILTCALNPQYKFDFNRSHDENSQWNMEVFIILTLNGVSSIVATVLNLLIVLGILTTQRRRSPTYILLCNLAFTDFVIGAAMGPISTMYFVLSDYEQLCVLFKAFSYLGLFLGSSSLYTLTCISYDRYLAIQMRTKYRTVVTNSRAYKTIAIVWLVSLIGPIFMCFLSRWGVYLLICCVQVFCLIIIVDCYSLSFGLIKKRQKEIKRTIQQTFEILPETRPRSRESANATISICSTKKSTIPTVVESDSDEMQPKNNDSKKHSKHNSSSKDKAGDQKISAQDIPERQSHIESISYDQDCSLKLKKQLTRIESEKSPGNEEMMQEEDGKQKSNETGRRSDTKRETARDFTAANQIGKRRPHSLLADIEKFKKSLNTILIIVLALFICYLPFLVIIVLATLQVIHISTWYDFAVIILYFHSCLSPVILCIRIAGIRKACWRVLKKMSYCSFLRK